MWRGWETEATHARWTGQTTRAGCQCPRYMRCPQFSTQALNRRVYVAVRVRGPGLRTVSANPGLVDPIIVQQRVLDALHHVLKRTTAPICPKLGHACTQSSATEAHSHNSI